MTFKHPPTLSFHEASGHLSRRLPGGRVHIERYLPFVLLHRSPEDGNDLGTRELVETEAAYLTLDPGSECDVDQLIADIAAPQLERFGAFLVTEVWARKPTATERSAPNVRVLAPAHRAPSRMLEELETELVAITVEDRPLTVSVEYVDEWAPPGLPPIGLDGLCHVGIEVPAVYRDEDSGKLLPSVHRNFRRDLGHAIRRGLYAYMHDHTPSQPEHFHELGPPRRSPTSWQRSTIRSPPSPKGSIWYCT